MTEQEEKAIIELLHSPDEKNNALGVRLAANTFGVDWIYENIKELSEVYIQSELEFNYLGYVITYYVHFLEMVVKLGDEIVYRDNFMKFTSTFEKHPNYLSALIIHYLNTNKIPYKL